MSGWQPSLLMHWYDRNPSSKAEGWVNVGVAPHGVTKRVSFTCPDEKIAMVELLEVHVHRATVATTPIKASATFKLTPKQGTMKTILTARITVLNTVGDKDGHSIGSTLMLFAGDILEGYTEDLSTGGTCDYLVLLKVTEFDFEPPKSYVYAEDLTPKEDIQQPEAVTDPKM